MLTNEPSDDLELNDALGFYGRANCDHLLASDIIYCDMYQDLNTVVEAQKTRIADLEQALAIKTKEMEDVVFDKEADIEELESIVDGRCLQMRYGY